MAYNVILHACGGQNVTNELVKAVEDSALTIILQELGYNERFIEQAQAVRMWLHCLDVDDASQILNAMGYKMI